MSSERILRLKRADGALDSFVLLHVVGHGASPLHLMLTASEGELTYLTKIKLDQVSQFRDQLYRGTDEEFGAAVRKSLLLERPQGSLSQGLEGVEFLAEIHKAEKAKKKKRHMSLIWRGKIGEINQKVGQIDLPEYTGDEEIDTFNWADIAAQNSEDSRRHVESLETQLDAQTETISRLQSQLDSIVQAKAEHEGLLLHKFAELINSKKAKIRDQQRLLATAKVDPDALSRIAPLTSGSRTAAESRSAKRKANARAEPSDDESSDGFEDAVPGGLDQEMQDAGTPDDTDDGTEDEEAEKPIPSPVKRGIRRRIGGRAPVEEEKKAPEPPITRSTRGNSKAPEKAPEIAPEENVPPPKRELPFGRKKAAEPAPRIAKDDDKTDDDDDEL